MKLMVEIYVSNLTLLAVMLGMVAIFFRQSLFINYRPTRVTLGILGSLLFYLWFLVAQNNVGFVQLLSNEIGKQWHLDFSLLLSLLIVVCFYWFAVIPANSSLLASCFWTSILVEGLYASQFIGDIVFNQLLPLLQSLHVVSVWGRTGIELILVVATTLMLKYWLKPTLAPTTNRNQFVQITLILMVNLSTMVLFYFMRDIYYPVALSFEKVWLVVLIIVVLNIFVLVIYQGQNIYYLKLHQIERENEILQREIATINLTKANWEKITAIKHDLRNQNIILLGLIEQGDYDQAKTLIRNGMSGLTIGTHFFTRNTLLNYLLNEKNNLAKAQGIQLDSQILVPKSLTIPNDILAIVIGNLLDNAFSAVARHRQGKQIVSLVVKAVNQKLLIQVSNAFNVDEVDSRRDRLQKGFGLKNIKQIVEKYDGLYQQQTNGSQYDVSIIFFDI